MMAFSEEKNYSNFIPLKLNYEREKFNFDIIGSELKKLKKNKNLSRTSYLKLL